MPRTALFPGSFDPVTNGHLDLVRQAARFADRLVLAIGIHPGKTTLFSADERLAMLRETCAPIAQASGCDFECVTFAGLVVAAAQREGATLLVRGLRSATDFDYEMEMAGMNAVMAPGRADVFLPASPSVRPITATLVRQIASMGGDVSPFVPPSVALRLKQKFAGIVPAIRPEQIRMIRMFALAAALLCCGARRLPRRNCRPASILRTPHPDRHQHGRDRHQAASRHCAQARRTHQAARA